MQITWNLKTKAKPFENCSKNVLSIIVVIIKSRKTFFPQKI